MGFILQASFAYTFLIVSAFAACPNFNAVPNVNLEEYSGDWQIHVLFRNFGGDPGMKCLHVDMESANWTVAPVEVDALLHGEYVATDVEFEQKLPGRVPNLNETGKWTVNINGTTFEHTILHTDSDNSLVVSCTPITDFDNFLIILFNSRTSEPMNATVIDQYKQILQDEYQIDGEAFYFPIQHDPEACEHDHP